jgi:ABC-type Fe3+-siderophore transport system permease subunit
VSAGLPGEGAIVRLAARATWPGRLGGWTLATAGLGMLFVLSCSIGKYPVAPGDLASLLVAKALGLPHGVPGVQETVVLRVRLPRVAAAMLVGAALSASGAAYQGVFRNPLVSPDILGVSAGAALGASLGLFLALPVVAIQILAFGCGLGAVALVCLIAAAVVRYDPALVLILAGIVVGTLFTASISLLKFLADPYNTLPAILVLDEPTANLDFGNQVRVLGVMARLATQGLAVVIATHFPDHAFLVASQVPLLQGGRWWRSAGHTTSSLRQPSGASMAWMWR